MECPILDATEYGVNGNLLTDQRSAFQRAFDAAASLKNAIVQLPPGHIVIEAPPSENDPWLTINNNGKVLIRGERDMDGKVTTTLVRHWHGAYNNKRLKPFIAIKGDGELSLEALNFDADPLFYTAGEVVCENPLRVRILPGHPCASQMAATQVAILDQHTHDLLLGKIDWTLTVRAVQDPVNPDLMVIEGDTLDHQPRIGQLLIWYFAFDGGECITIDGASRIDAADLNFHCTNGFAFHFKNVGDVHLRALDFSPPSGRLASHPRDLIHGSEITGTVLIEDSHFAGAQDDGINLHSFYLQVAERRDARTCLMRPVHLNNRYTKSPTGWPIKLHDGGAIDFLDENRSPALRGQIVSWSVEGYANLLTVDVDLPDWVTVGTWVDPRCMLPEKTIIRRCTFRNITSRGIKCSVHDCLIEDCRFENISSPGVHLTGEFDWEESTTPCNVTINRCSFKKCDMQDLHGYFKRAAVLVQPKEVPGKARVCRNIQITNSTFIDCPNDAIQLYHAEDVRVENCTFENVRGAPIWHDPNTSDPARSSDNRVIP